ncbi:MAG: hypothetical protein Q8J97_13900, partial [Flavobacteriaceae bacterium]|nr:hypothetical protein [Flavobacteriaceae bacterium]
MYRTPQQVRAAGDAHWSLSVEALHTFEELLGALEVHRVCRTDDERARYTKAMAELVALRDA